ncbi:MAG: hypothetical protein KAH57_11265 [Thermoplasmata archaeon]|nr:hypothetical protein [Thermoplasmata archaeon]
MTLNCWEITKCGKQPNGDSVDEMGECPTATCSEFDGKNKGENGGRYCWRVSGTLCNGELQPNWADKMKKCMDCPVMKVIMLEEGENFEP